MNKIKMIEVFAFLLVIGGISIGSLAAKDRAFSENENRNLAKLPEFSIEKVMDCSFQDELEEYLKDQVCFRDGWISVKTFFQKNTGNTDIGGAYVGKDGFNFEKIMPEDVDDMQVRKNIKAVDDYFGFCNETLGADKTGFVIIPTSGLVYGDKLPKNAIMFDQNKYIDQIVSSVKNGKIVDAREVLKGDNDKQLYYKTDHHWTTDGAFLVSIQWREAFGKTKVEAYSIEEEVVTKEFKGSLYSKILDVDSQKDLIKVFNKNENDDFVVEANGKDIGGFYQKDKLETKDKYAYFFGGNYGEVVITNKKAKGNENLLIVKDSFANSFVPLIAGEYNKIYMVDLRYYPGDMSKYLEENDITEVVVLYNVSNFISDKNIFKLTRGIRR